MSLRGGLRLGLATLGSDPLQAQQARTAHPRRGGQGLLSAEQSLTLWAAGTSAHQGPPHLLPHSHRTHFPEADTKALGRCAGKRRAPCCSGRLSQTRARPTVLHSLNPDQPLQLSTMLEGRRGEDSGLGPQGIQGVPHSSLWAAERRRVPRKCCQACRLTSGYASLPGRACVCPCTEAGSRWETLRAVQSWTTMSASGSVQDV